MKQLLQATIMMFVLAFPAPFNFPEDHELFKSRQNKYAIEIYSIICSISKEERKRRIKERERHHAHYDVDRQLYDSVDSLEYEIIN